MMGFRRFSLVYVLSSILALTSCSQEYPQVIIGTNLWPGYEPLYIAKAKGLFGQGIRVVQYHSASDVMRETRNGVLNAVALTVDEFLLLRETGHNFCIFLIADVSNGADTILVRPPAKSLSDLKGRKIAIEASALGAYMISRALELNSLSSDDFEIVNIPVSEHVEAYRRGEIDAMVTFEPYRTLLRNEGALEIFTSRELPGEVIDIVAVNRDLVRSQNRNLNDLRRGWFDALEMMNSSPDQTNPLIARRLKVAVSEVPSIYESLRIPSESENEATLKTRPAELLNSIRKLRDVMMSGKLLEVALPIEPSMLCSHESP